MKKTLLSSLLSIALAAAASAASITETVYQDTNITSSSTRSVDVAELWTSSTDDYTLTFTLNVDNLSDLIGAEQGRIEGQKDLPTLVSITGLSGGTAQTICVAMGTGSWGTSTSHPTNYVLVNGLLGNYGANAGTSDTVSTYANASKYYFTTNGSTPNVGSMFDVDVSDVVSAAVTLTSNVSSATSIYLTLRDSMGNESTYYGSCNSLAFSSGFSDITNIAFNSDMVSSVYLMEGVANLATASSLNAAAMDAIPEPTTATLSLLALAGLAARRRRK